MKNYLKRTILCLLAAVMLFGVVGCAKQKPAAAKKTHDSITLIETGTDKVLPHNYADGKCVYCGKETVFRQIPIKNSKEITAAQPADKQGTVEEFWYKTRAYGVEAAYPEEGEMHIVKRGYVYLPAGYDPADTARRYNVMLKFHGDKINEGYWFQRGSYADPSAQSAYTGGYCTENMLDYMFANGLAEDTIVVGVTTYSYYNGTKGSSMGGNQEMGNIYNGYIDPDYEGIDTAAPKMEDGTKEEFYKEVVNDLLPYLIENYKTYAASSAEEDIIAARDHFACTGECGGARLSSILLKTCLPYFAYWGFESGPFGGDLDAGDLYPTPFLLDDFMTRYNNEWKGKYDFKYIYTSCGSMEQPELFAARLVESAQTLGFTAGSDIKNGDKIDYMSIFGTAHNYATWVTDLYNELLVFFKG